jgi:hypothetical protein
MMVPSSSIVEACLSLLGKADIGISQARMNYVRFQRDNRIDVSVDEVFDDCSVAARTSSIERQGVALLLLADGIGRIQLLSNMI